MPNVFDLDATHGCEHRMTGRAYLDEWARRLGIDELDPAAIHEELEPLELRHGPTESRLGGRLTRNLRRLSPAEIEERRQRSEAFLTRPAQRFPADEEAAARDEEATEGD